MQRQCLLFALAAACAPLAGSQTVWILAGSIQTCSFACASRVGVFGSTCVQSAFFGYPTSAADMAAIRASAGAPSSCISVEGSTSDTSLPLDSVAAGIQCQWGGGVGQCSSSPPGVAQRLRPRRGPVCEDSLSP